jgi:thiol-disulfide isomerase/thioredoxin
MKIKILIILLGILLLIGVSVFLLFNKIQKMQETKLVYQYLPVFSLSDVNGNVITNKTLQKNIPILFLFFNLDCELCREEIEHVKLNQEAFSQGQIVFFTNQTTDIIRHFLQEIDFRPAPNMLFLIDKNEDLMNRLNVKLYPTSYIYNRDGTLIKRFDGSVKIETLIKYLSEQQ